MEQSIHRDPALLYTALAFRKIDANRPIQLLDLVPNYSRHGLTFPTSGGLRKLNVPDQILTGVLRHYATVLLASTPKKLELPAIREQRSLLRGINLRNNAHCISPSAFAARKNYMISAYKEGAFLKDPDNRGKAAANPMTDPAAMEGMMGMMKGNMAMMVPQTLIMGWINAFFAGYVIMKLPFPLTLRFKSMLQSGVATRDLDVRWVSSLSWYFLNLFGLQSVFIFILGNDNGMFKGPSPVKSQRVDRMND